MQHLFRRLNLLAVGLRRSNELAIWILEMHGGFIFSFCLFFFQRLCSAGSIGMEPV
jgi:hypothetical protein